MLKLTSLAENKAIMNAGMTSTRMSNVRISKARECNMGICFSCRNILQWSQDDTIVIFDAAIFDPILGSKYRIVAIAKVVTLCVADIERVNGAPTMTPEFMKDHMDNIMLVPAHDYPARCSREIDRYELLDLV